MKTIYNAILDRLQAQVPALKWIDLDTGQLSTPKPPVQFPCALVSVKLPQCKSVTDREQDCRARITVRFGYSNQLRTAAATPAEARAASMAVYDTIAAIYAALQGYETANFDSLSRVSQGEEAAKNGLFIYKFEFDTQFVDDTAEA